ncbi:MAG: WYL domain-containing protein [Oscillospiraceae bacterium]|nr:WYL domain-containing protein [Oscillospiraceae bacterium]
MYTSQSKKLLIINILDILRKYTDADHRLNQKDIVDILKAEYGMSVDRKSIRRNILGLMEYGYEIEYKETIRMVPVRDPDTGKPALDPTTGKPKLEESYVWSDFYLVREFTDGELRLLIDSLLFSKHIPYSQCKELVGKLEGLSNKHFQSRVRHIHTFPDNMPQNKQLFWTIETLDEAIGLSRQVSFTYNEYGMDKQLHPRLNSEGKPRVYIVNPYQMAATNGRYYLIGNYNKYDDVANYRLDRITDIQLLETPRKPAKEVKGLENGVDLPKHMAEHIYMFSGESAPVAFRFKKYLLSDVIDWFGKEVVFSDETEEEVTARVTVNLEAMRRWALQYALHTRILSPQNLTEKVKADIMTAMKQYE